MIRYRFFVIIVACLSVLSTALRAQSYDMPEVWRFHESSIYYITLQDANGRSINNQFAQTPRAIGAYVGGELRGVSEQITVNSSNGLTVFSIRVWGDSNDPETVDFHVRSNDLEYLLASCPFKGGEEENYGLPSSPIIFKLVPVTQMQLSPSPVSVIAGKSLYLKPVLEPQDHSALLTKLTYTFTATNNSGIFTVDDNGLVSGLASGQGTIHVQAKDGNRIVFTASVAISVLNAPLPVTGFDVAVTGAVAGQTGTITLKPQPAGSAFDADNFNITIRNTSIPSSWNDQFIVTRKSVSTEQVVYEFCSSVPGNVIVTVVDGNNMKVLLNDPTATTRNSFSGFEIGWPLSLNSGWQWCSNPCGKISTTDFETVFSTADLYEIRTKSDLLNNDPKWGFYGTLMNTAGLEQFQCYKVKMKKALDTVIYPSSSAAANGTATIGAELKLTLKPGWNWIGHPYFFDRLLRNVISTKVKELDGAVFVGKNGSAELDNGIWEGNLVKFEAGQGYLFKNPSSKEVTITLPSEFATMIAGNEGPSAARSLSDGVWNYDASQFMNNMTIVAVLDGIAHPERYSIGAFVNNECRGGGEIIGGKAFITVHCVDGEQVNFCLYDQYSGTYSKVNEGLKAQMRVGSLKVPIKLHISDSEIGITDATPGMVSTECYDLSGRQLKSTSRGISLQRTAASTYRKVVIK